MWKILIPTCFVIASVSSKINLSDWPYGKVPLTKPNNSSTPSNLDESDQINEHYYNASSEERYATFQPQSGQDEDMYKSYLSVDHGGQENNQATSTDGSAEMKGTFEYSYTGKDGEEVRVYASEPEYFDDDDVDEQDIDGVLPNISLAEIDGISNRRAKADRNDPFATPTRTPSNSTDPVSTLSNTATNDAPIIVRQDGGIPIPISSIEPAGPKPRRCRVHHYHNHLHNSVHTHYHCYHNPPEGQKAPTKQEVVQHVHHHHGCVDKKADAAKKLVDGESATLVTRQYRDVIGKGEADKGSDKEPDKVPDKVPDKGTDKVPDKGTDKIPEMSSQQVIHHHHHHHNHNHRHCRHIHHHSHNHRHTHHHRFRHCPKNPNGGSARGDFDVTGSQIMNPHTNSETVDVTDKNFAPGKEIYVKPSEGDISEIGTTINPMEWNNVVDN